MGEPGQDEQDSRRVEADHNSTSTLGPSSTRQNAAFSVCGRLRQLALASVAVMGLWPLALQIILVPESVFGDGHGDRYEQLSYFAFEDDLYQVLAPRKVVCSDLQGTLFGGVKPTPTTDLLRAVPQSTFELIRSLVVNQTAGDHAEILLVTSDILELSTDQSLCFGGVDAEGAIQIEALLSTKDSPSFGVDASCLQNAASHVRLRLQSTEFYVPDTLGELNPSRKAGAIMIMSIVDSVLAPVESTCYSKTRQERSAVTATNAKYVRLISEYSKQLMVSSSCSGFTLYGGTRDTFGCAYSAIGTSGAVVDVNSDGKQRTYSFPAPWRMIQCTSSGECSSLLFTQIWLSEWTVEKTTADEMLRHNFVNHKVIEVTVDSTFSIRLVISLQILALVVTAYLTSVRGWYKMKSSFISPWAKVANATTSCTIAKVVRSSYNFVLVAQMALGILQWPRSADINQAVLRAFGCGTLVVVLAINIVFARAGDLKMQEMEPSFAQVVVFFTSVILFCISRTNYALASARTLLATGMHSVSAADVPKYSGCRGSSVCAMETSLSVYTVVLIVVIVKATFIGLTAHATLQATVRATQKVGARPRSSRRSFHIGSSQRESICPDVNSFTRFLDDRSRRTSLYDCSTEVYVQATGGTLLSTRGQLEASGFVLASSILFRYRDLPLFLVARVLPAQILNFFNLTVITYELIDTNKELNGVPVRLVADQVIHTHWSKLQDARLDWLDGYFGGDGETSYRSTESIKRQSIHNQTDT